MAFPSIHLEKPPDSHPCHRKPLPDSHPVWEVVEHSLLKNFAVEAFDFEKQDKALIEHPIDKLKDLDQPQGVAEAEVEMGEPLLSCMKASIGQDRQMPRVAWAELAEPAPEETKLE